MIEDIALMDSVRRNWDAHSDWWWWLIVWWLRTTYIVARSVCVRFVRRSDRGVCIERCIAIE